jgi:hypothetical protein
MKFRVPRKTKKKIKNTIYLYPPNEDGSSLMAFPLRSQKDFDAYKQGIVQPLFDYKKAKNEPTNWEDENTLTVEEIHEAVEHIFAQEYIEQAKRILVRAMNDVHVKKEYLIFVNSWLDTKNGNDKSITMCMVYDDILRKYHLS